MFDDDVTLLQVVDAEFPGYARLLATGDRLTRFRNADDNENEFIHLPRERRDRTTVICLEKKVPSYPVIMMMITADRS